MLRVKHVQKDEGDAAGEASQSKKRRVMLRVKHLSLKRRGDAAGEAPQSQKRREMLRAKHLSLKRRG